MGMTKETTGLHSQMQSMVKEWKQSGQSKKAFCAERSLGYYKFNYWCKRLGIRSRKYAGGVKSSFIEVQLSQPSQGNWMEIVYPDGRRIVFHKEVGANFLRTLLN